ncbi:MAG: hypothetical protein IIC85_12580 [Chloroflexi bacterium]|nr:hypothetical protein [Chloroflexota bacterium]
MDGLPYYHFDGIRRRIWPFIERKILSGSKGKLLTVPSRLMKQFFMDYHGSLDERV